MLSSALKVASSRSASSIAARIASVWPAPSAGTEQCQLEPRAQPRQRRLQIVRDIVGDLAHAGHQPLDLVEHAVEIGGELVELVARAASGTRSDRLPAMTRSPVRFTCSTRRSMLRLITVPPNSPTPSATRPAHSSVVLIRSRNAAASLMSRPTSRR